MAHLKQLSRLAFDELAQDFNKFFINKVEGIRKDISEHALSEANSKQRNDNNPTAETCNLTHFRPTTEEEVEKIIMQSPNKSCELDPVPTWLLKECKTELLPILANHQSFDGNSKCAKILQNITYKTLIKKAHLRLRNTTKLSPSFESAICFKIIGESCQQKNR